MTAYGERLAREIGGALARAGALVVSGLAQGIDATAHAAALDAGGRTAAVLGAGIDAYLQDVGGSARHLAARIVARGALLSQYPPDAPALGWMFARRNETMAALGDVVVVIEAPEGSGALITAADARRIGRPVHAVPGPVGATAARGSNGLIAAGRARALVDVAAFVAELGLGGAAAEVAPAHALAEILSAGPLHPDRAAASLGISPAALAALVLPLILDGRVVQTPDGRLALGQMRVGASASA
jgi:DNA processing protein